MATYIDPAILELIDKVSVTKQFALERRNSPRHAFRIEQRFAPIEGGRLPGFGELRPVTCKDISLSGVSFFAAWPPAFDEAVVELGVAPALKYLRVKVVGCMLCDLALPEYLVRCQFVGRVSQADLAQKPTCLVASTESRTC